MKPVFSSYQTFSTALARARTVDLAAYTLGSGKTERGLIAAAAAGAHVRVRLAGTVYNDPQGELALHNAHEAALLSAYGIDAAVSDAQAMHLKAAVIDGRVFLDDRNFCNGDDLVVATSEPADIAATEATLAGSAAARTADGLAFTKGDAVHEEAALLTDPGDAVELQTETIGSSLITKLLAAAAEHARVRVLFTRHTCEKNPRVIKVFDKLIADGVDVHTTSENDKFCLAGERAWTGSANASGGDPRMSDWGIIIDDTASISLLRSRFESAWIKSKPLSHLAT